MSLLKSIIEVLFWTLMGFLAIGLIIFLFGWGISPAMGYVAAIGLIVLIPMLARTLGVARRRRGAAVLAYLEQAVRLNMPLPLMIAAAQRSEEGKLAARLSMLSRQLNSGAPLSAAVERSVPELSLLATSSLDAGERIGRLPHVLGRLIRQHSAKVANDSTDTAFFRAYPFMMIIAVTAVVAMQGVFVLPKFQVIFSDFGIQLPAITLATFNAIYVIGPFACVLAIALLLGWIIMTIWRLVHPVSARWNVLHRLRDQLLWSLPFTHGLARDRGLTDACDLMAEAIRAGQPVHRAAGEASRLRINEVLRGRIASFAICLNAGESLDQAARSSRLPGLMVEMLAPVRGAGVDSAHQASDVFTFLSRYYDARFSRARVLLEAAAVPLIVLFFAVIVACVCLSLFLPLISLIQSTAGSTRFWRL